MCIGSFFSSISALGATKSSFIFLILALGATESFIASLSSKSYPARCFSTGALGWNYSFLQFWYYPSVIQRFDMFTSLDLQYIYFIIFKNKNPVHVCKTFLLTTHIVNQRFDLADCLWKWHLLVLYFYFLFSKYFWRIVTTDSSISSKSPLFFNPITWCYWFLRQCDNHIGLHDFCAWYSTAKLLTPDTGQTPKRAVKI